MNLRASPLRNIGFARRAFTLIELLVVIAIIAILGVRTLSPPAAASGAAAA